MPRRNLPRYVSAFTGQHGRTRYQFRRKGFARYYFQALPWTDEFMEEYRRCMAGEAAPKLQPGQGRVPQGSLSALAVAYYGSAGYQNLADSTKAVYRRIIEGLRAKDGDKPVALMRRRHVRKIIDAKAATPHAANRALKILRLLMAHALELGWIESDPTAGIKFIKTSGDGIHTWSEAELAQFIATHPKGTTAHLAMALMLYTGQRLSDAIRLGWQHVDLDNGTVTIVQQKSQGRTRLEIPLHPDLADLLADLPRENMTFLVTSFGAPYSAKGFPAKMRKWCDEAGLPQCSSHGLRKLMATRLADAGASAHEIASITGHKSLQEVQRYTKAASQKRLSRQALDRLQGTGGEQEMSHPQNAGDNSAEKASKIKVAK